jgi:hypothetical protein
MFGVPATWIFASSNAEETRLKPKHKARDKRKINVEWLDLFAFTFNFIRVSVC